MTEGHYAPFYFMKKIVSSIIVIVLLGVAFFTYNSLNKRSEKITPLPTPKKEEPAPVAETTIIAFGDSLTAGYGLPLSESYPAQLEKALLAKGISVKVINAGVSGETTAGNRERALFIASQNPDIVLLGIGGNDALRALPLDETEKNMRETIGILKNASSSPKIFLLQMQAPLNGGIEYKKSFDSIYPKLAKEFSLPLIPFITESLFRKEYLLSDGIHLNKEGYGIFVVNYLIPEVEKVLKK